MALGMADSDKDVRYHSMDGEGGHGTGTVASSKQKFASGQLGIVWNRLDKYL